MSSYTQYRKGSLTGGTADTDTQFSPNVWHDCPTAEVLHGGRGWEISEDWQQRGVTGTITTIIEQTGYNFPYIDFPTSEYPTGLTPNNATECVYPFGMDPTWFLSEQDILVVQDSMKMKISVIHFLRRRAQIVGRLLQN